MILVVVVVYAILFLPLNAGACPIGMQFNGNGCSPPYVYTGWDMMRDRRAAIDAMGSYSQSSAPALSDEQLRKLRADIKQQEAETEQKKNDTCKRHLGRRC